VIYNSALENKVLDDKTNHLFNSTDTVESSSSSEPIHTKETKKVIKTNVSGSGKRNQPLMTRAQAKNQFKATPQAFHGMHPEDAMGLFIST
jgi:hypothetical protein